MRLRKTLLFFAPFALIVSGYASFGADSKGHSLQSDLEQYFKTSVCGNSTGTIEAAALARLTAHIRSENFSQYGNGPETVFEFVRAKDQAGFMGASCLPDLLLLARPADWTSFLENHANILVRGGREFHAVSAFKTLTEAFIYDSITGRPRFYPPGELDSFFRFLRQAFERLPANACMENVTRGYLFSPATYLAWDVALGDYDGFQHAVKSVEYLLNSTSEYREQDCTGPSNTDMITALKEYPAKKGSPEDRVRRELFQSVLKASIDYSYKDAVNGTLN
jgi:hypothetical protein